jgi:hypothetical protein
MEERNEGVGNSLSRREFLKKLAAGAGLVLVGCKERKRSLSVYPEVGEAAEGQACMYTIQEWELDQNPQKTLENVARAIYGRENEGMWRVLEVIRNEDEVERCYALTNEHAERTGLPYLNPAELRAFDIVTTPKDCQRIVSERNK